jgi:phosphopantothenoylcysteine synthetase/decarboxylase
MKKAPTSLQGRRILVTAGPTWVRVDAVRHLGNVSSGRTGLEIARKLADRGAEVTLLFGPGRALPTIRDERTMAIRHFETFDDLYGLVKTHVGSGNYDAMVHSAAVSDYEPVEVNTGKLSSEAEELVIRLRRTPKIVDEVKELDPGILLVKFKLEVGKSEEQLVRIARESALRSGADLMVANDLSGLGEGRHAALILAGDEVLARCETNEELAEQLADQLALRLTEGWRRK